MDGKGDRAACWTWNVNRYKTGRSKRGRVWRNCTYANDKIPNRKAGEGWICQMYLMDSVGGGLNVIIQYVHSFTRHETWRKDTYTHSEPAHSRTSSSIRGKKLHALPKPFIDRRGLAVQSTPRVLPGTALVELETRVLARVEFQMAVRSEVRARDRQTEQLPGFDGGVGGDCHGSGVEDVAQVGGVVGGGA